jgi:hypothetical protein
VVARVRALGEPGVELQLEVALVGEGTARLKALLDEVLQALDDALGLRIRRLTEVPIDPELPAERRELVGRAALAGVQPGLAIPDQQLGQGA